MTETMAAGGVSAAQALYDRLRLQCNRFNKIGRRLEQVLAQVAAGKPSRIAAEEPAAPENRPLAFFDGLSLLADANDRIAEALERRVEDLADLF